MNNVTARPGQTATFKCQVDMSCIVSYIEWYHEMDNGTEKLIKVSLSPPLGLGLSKCQYLLRFRIILKELIFFMSVSPTLLRGLHN